MLIDIHQTVDRRFSLQNSFPFLQTSTDAFLLQELFLFLQTSTGAYMTTCIEVRQVILDSSMVIMKKDMSKPKQEFTELPADEACEKPPQRSS